LEAGKLLFGKLLSGVIRFHRAAECPAAANPPIEVRTRVSSDDENYGPRASSGTTLRDGGIMIRVKIRIPHWVLD